METETKEVCGTCQHFNPHTRFCQQPPRHQGWFRAEPDAPCDFGDAWEPKPEPKDPGTYDASGEPAVREILDCLERLKEQDTPAGHLPDVLRISVQVHNLIRQREEARLVAVTLATVFAMTKTFARTGEKLKADDSNLPAEVQTVLDDLVGNVREHGRDKVALYWPKGGA